MATYRIVDTGPCFVTKNQARKQVTEEFRFTLPCECPGCPECGNPSDAPKAPRKTRSDKGLCKSCRTPRRVGDICSNPDCSTNVTVVTLRVRFSVAADRATTRRWSDKVQRVSTNIERTA